MRPVQAPKNVLCGLEQDIYANQNRLLEDNRSDALVQECLLSHETQGSEILLPVGLWPERAVSARAGDFLYDRH